MFDALHVDLKYALRSLRSQLQFSGMVIGILATGVAAVTVVFSIIYVLILAPSVIGNTERLGWIFGVDTRTATDRGLLSIPEYLDIRERAQSFEMLAARSRNTVILTGHGQAMRLAALRVTVNHLPVWNIRLARGRPFDATDEVPGAEPVAILNYHIWQSRLGGDETIVGRTISLDGESVLVIGILDPKYPTGALGDLWMPLAVESGRGDPRDRRTLSAVGLLKPGVDLRAAHEEIHSIALQMQREHPATNTGLDFRVVDTWTGRTGPQTYYNLGLLGVAALLVLIIGCVNVALLLLARAISRQRDVMVRLAVGAPRFRIVVQQAFEGLLLALPAAAIGLGMAIWLILALKASGDPSLARLSIDWTVFRTAVVVSLLLPVIFAVVPAMGVGMTGTLKLGESRGMEGSRSSRRQQRMLAMVQVGSALMLLVVAGIVLRSFMATLVADFGLNQKNLLNVSLTLPAWKFEQPDQFSRFFTAAVDRIAALGDVSSAAATGSVPGLQAAGPSRVVRTNTADPSGSAASQLSAQLISVTPRAFETLGVPVVAGREFSANDTSTAPLVVVINRKLARAASARPEELVGHRLAIGDEPRWREIVGIVGDTRDVDFDSFAPLVFLPHAQQPQRTMTLLARMPHGVSPQLVTDAIFETDPDVAPYLVRTYEEGVSTRVSGMLTLFGMFGAMAAAAALLAAVGLYGAFSCAVGGRMREFGVRQALGASTSQIRRLVFREGWWTVLPGIVFGMLGGAALSRYAVGVLYAVTTDPLDPLTYFVCGVFLFVACALALWIPARRAARAQSALADLLR